jgi:iron(III) transport system ATP-binding protein
MYYNTDRGRVHAVRGVSVNVLPGQFYTMLGPSGCGKTTTLRCVAGLEVPSEGEIFIGDELVFSSSKKISIPPYKRDIGMVFQSYAIWPHMTVFENVAFPLREMGRRYSKKEIQEKVLKALALVQLNNLEDRPAPFLSGGQQQRLALARALVKEPRVLLLDEPLSNLDAKLREETRVEMRELVKRLGITTLYVTHDQLEALTMSDVVAVMSEGRIVQEGSPVEIYQTPRERFVANFIGLANFIEGRVKAVDSADKGMGRVETSSGVLACRVPEGISIGDQVVIVVRPEDVSLVNGPSASDENVLAAKVKAVIFMGDALECTAAVGDQQLRMKLHPSSAVKEGSTVHFQIPSKSCRILQA